jgi:hypothetical protein
LNNFQYQRLELQKKEIDIMKISSDFNMKRMKAQDGYNYANNMLKDHGQRMSDQQSTFWFNNLNNWAVQLANFQAVEEVNIFDTPFDTNELQDKIDEDTTLSSRLFDSNPPKKQKSVKDSTVNNYAAPTNKSQSGRPPLPQPSKDMSSTTVESVIQQRSKQAPPILESFEDAFTTLEYILGPEGEMISDPVPLPLQSTIALYQSHQPIQYIHRMQPP